MHARVHSSRVARWVLRRAERLGLTSARQASARERLAATCISVRRGSGACSACGCPGQHKCSRAGGRTTGTMATLTGGSGRRAGLWYLKGSAHAKVAGAALPGTSGRVDRQSVPVAAREVPTGCTSRALQGGSSGRPAAQGSPTLTERVRARERTRFEARPCEHRGADELAAVQRVPCSARATGWRDT